MYPDCLHNPDIGHVTIFKEFLSNGANVNAKTSEEESVLHVAIKQNFYGHYQESLEIIQLLLKDESIDLNVTNEDGLTPLEKALNLKHMEIARMIAKKMCPLPICIRQYQTQESRDALPYQF